MRNVRITAFILMVIMLFYIFPFKATAAITSASEYYAYITGLRGDIKDSQHRTVSWYMYQQYGLEVYTNSDQPYGFCNAGEEPWYNQVKNRNEYRYLGYQRDSISSKITNTYYPADPGGGGSPTSWTYRVVDNNSASWESPDTDQREYMLSAPLSYMGTLYPSLTVNSLGGTAKAKLQTAATWQTAFSVFTQHMYNNRLRYATLTGAKMGEPVLNCTVKTYSIGSTSTECSSYTIAADEGSIKIPVQVFAAASIPAGSKAKVSQISKITAAFESVAESAAKTLTANTAVIYKTIKKSDFGKPGAYSVTLKGSGSLQSVYKDSLTASGSKTITIIVADTTAYVDVTAVADPAAKLVTGSADETITVTAKAELKQYANAGNVKSWEWYARFEEDTTAQYYLSPGNSLSSARTFTFTVPKSKLSGESYLQRIKVTAVANFIEKVGNDSALQGSAYTETDFYRNTVPSQPLGEPVAVISAPNYAAAGNLISVNGYGSHSPNGAITDYYWELPGALATTMDTAAGSVTYMNAGTYDITLYVTDTAGKQARDMKTITVTPPLPTAAFFTSGSLKENRKFTIDAGISTSSALFPIVAAKTSWTITALSGGTAADIKYSGTLYGNVKNDILIKKAGTYAISLTVTNTAGYSDTLTKNITIAEDLSPSALFYSPDTAIRSPDTGGMAVINVSDQSYSPDNDVISTRIWSYIYDSDNDGSFSDETKTVSFGDNGANQSFKAAEVGKYKLRLLVKESFGQDTIPDFISDSDYKTAVYEHTIEVKNTAPAADLALVERLRADVSVLTDYTGAKLSSLISELNSLKSSVYENNVDLNYTINDGSSSIKIADIQKEGRLARITSTWDSYWYVFNTSLSSYPNAALASAYQIASYDSNVTGGNRFYCFVTDDGDLYTWGSNNSPIYAIVPQTTDGSYANTPVNLNGTYAVGTPDSTVPGPYTYIGPGYTYKDAFATNYAIMSLETNGTVRRHGQPWYHQVVFISGVGNARPFYWGGQEVATNVKQIDGGGEAVIMLKNDGTVWGVGDGIFSIAGPAANCTPYCQSYNGIPLVIAFETATPKQIPGLSNIKKIIYSEAVSWNDRCTYPTAYAIDTSNRVWTWGYVWPNCGVIADSKHYTSGYTLPANDIIQTPQIIPGLDGSTIADICYGRVNVPSGTVIDYMGKPHTNYSYVEGLKILKTDGSLWLYRNGAMTQVTSWGYCNYYIDSWAGIVVTDEGVYDTSSGVAAIASLAVLKSDGTLLTDKTKYSFSIPNWSIPVYAPDLDAFDTSSLRAGSDRYFMWISDGSGTGYSSGYGSYFGLSNLSAEFTARIISDNYAIIAVAPSSTYDYHSGLSSQELTLRNFVNSSPVSGALFDSGQYASAIAGIFAKYSAPADKVIDAYAIAGEDVIEYRTYYSDYEGDPKYSESWEYDHTPSYFDNDTGMADFSNRVMSEPITTFVNTGKYDLTYRVRDNPKNDLLFDNYKLWSGDDPQMAIYAHSRPLALFDAGFTGLDASGNYRIRISEYSYDPDHTSRTDKGIASKQWRYKNVKDGAWTAGQLPAVLPRNQKYLAELIVTDIEGAASMPKVAVIDTSGNNFIPDITLMPMSRDWRNTDVNVTAVAADATPDLSYINYLVTGSPARPSSGWIGITASNAEGHTFHPSVTGTGVWYIHAEAFDANDNSSYVCGGPYKIDKIAPAIDCTPTASSVCGEDIAVTVNASDTGGSNLSAIQYAWSASASTPVSGWTTINAGRAEEYSFNAELDSDGTYYLHMRATDIAGNTSTRYRGPFTRETLGISSVTLKGYWNHWRGQVNLFGELMTNEPHRFLSYEAVKIEVTTEGDPDSVTVRFSPALEAMYFTDIYGNRHSYEKDIGYSVSFPLEITKKDTNIYSSDYILPLAPSTKSSDNIRLAPPYWMQVTVTKGAVTKTYTINDIDITGNIWDHTYIQPLN